MLAHIRDNSWMYFEQVPPDFDNIIYDHFSVVHPRKRYIDTSFGWDGKIRRYERQYSRLGIGFLHELRQLCKQNGIQITVFDYRESHPGFASPIFKNMLKGISLYDHQIRAIEAAGKNDVGIIGVLTGGGKTNIAAGITKLFGLKTVIVCNQRIVIEQLKDCLELRDVGDGDESEKIGLFYGGATPSGQSVVVGSIQSLISPPTTLKIKNPAAYKSRFKRAKLFQQIVGEADVLIVDECSDIGNNEQYHVLFKKHFKGRFKYGLSASPFDKQKPIGNLIIKEFLGGVISSCTRDELEALGQTVPVKVYFMTYGKYDPYNDSAAFDIAEREQIIENFEFHNMVAAFVNKHREERVLIVVDTCNVELVGKALELAIPGSVFIYNKTSNSARKVALESFEKDELKCLIVSKIGKRGMDIKGGAHVILPIGGGKMWSNMAQMIGRAVRKNNKGYSTMYAFVCLGNKYLYRHGRAQIEATMNLGYGVKVITNKGIVCGKDFLKSFKRGR